MPNIRELLSQYLNVPETSIATLDELEKCCEIKTFKANEIIYREHENSGHLFIVLSGQVDVQYLLKDGRRKTLDTCLKGDHLLWSAVIEPHETNSIGICRAEADLLSIDGQKVLAICEKDPAFGYRLMSLIASVIRRRLQMARSQITAEKID